MIDFDRRSRCRSLVVSLAAAVSVFGCKKGGESETPATRALALSDDGGQRVSANDGAASVDLDRVYGRSHAVVIGIDEYQRVPKLGGAVRDAEVVAASLEARGFEVTTLLDEQATRTNIAAELGDRLYARVGPEDRVLVFFAGHGYSTGDGNHRMGYLLPVEADRSAVRATGLSMSELQSWLAGYPSKHVLFVADACYSGLALATRSTGMDASTKDYLRDVTTRRVRFTLVAGRDDQEAHEDTHSGHGVFTRFFLEGLDGAADANRDGLVTSDELAVFVKPQVSTYVSQNFQSSQTPQSARSGMGEFVFFSGVTAGTTSSEAARADSNTSSEPAKANASPAASLPQPKPAPAGKAPVASASEALPAESTPTAVETTTPSTAESSKHLPPGVAVAADQIVITTVSAARLRGHTSKAMSDARSKQRLVLAQTLAGPPFNVPQAQLDAKVSATLDTGQVDANHTRQNDAGDWEMVMRYTAQ